MIPIDPPVIQPDKGFVLSETLYNKLKWGVSIVLPALATLYFTLGAIWDLPATEQVMGTITAIATFGGVLLGLSTKGYNNAESRFDGAIVIGVDENTGQKIYSLELKEEADAIDAKKQILFKVAPQPLPPPGVVPNVDPPALKE